MPEQERGAVVQASQEFEKALVHHEPLGRNRPLEEPVPAVKVEPSRARGVGDRVPRSAPAGG